MRFFSLPQASAGVGLKAQHYRDILETSPAVGFFEVHAENYMGAGGPPHRYLTAIRARYPLTIHGVGLSIGGDRPLDGAHLRRLKELINRYDPWFFSEHLAWSTHDRGYLSDLLPLPYTREALARIIEHIDQVQMILGRPMLLENPARYLGFVESTEEEGDFLAEIADRSGCGLLLDVNNLYVSAQNLGTSAEAALAAFPLHHVGQIHLAGHASVEDGLLIDAHDRPVTAAVWSLYTEIVRRIGPVPTLIEWDTNVPPWLTLHAEAIRAKIILDTAMDDRGLHAAR